MYINVNLILVLISVVLTVIVLNLHFRGPKTRRVPFWIRKYIIGYLGRFFCFFHESRTFFRAHKETKIKELTKSKTILSKDQPFIEGNKFDDYNDNSDSPVLINTLSKIKTINKSKENYFYIENGDYEFEDGMLKKAIKNSNSVQSMTRVNQKNITEKSASNNLNEEISKNLEKMLVKMQKSFDPFKLRDQDLKFKLLKEILECQRLLLENNLTSLDKVPIIVNSIYDEWRILAMIIDRICFFIYFISLITSSTLFFIIDYSND